METDVKDVIQETAIEEVAPQVEAPVEQEDPQVKNIREMRLIKEKAEKERDEAYNLIQKMKKEYELKEAPIAEPEPVEEESDFDISDDEWVEPKHLKKVANEIKNLKKQLKSYQTASVSATTESKLKSKYNDFDAVVSKDNVEALVRDYPELGNTLRSNTDLYSQAVTAYTMIKQMGIYKEDKYANDRAKAELNAAKPRPLASVAPQQGDSPLTRANAFANGLTDEVKAQLFKEMNEARSRI